MAISATLAAQESPRPARGGPADRFQQLDRNGDGKISAEEFPGALFQQVDNVSIAGLSSADLQC